MFKKKYSKYFLITLLFTIISYLYVNRLKIVQAVAGSWSQTGNDLYYTEGKIGIGTTSPETPFHVVGSSGIGSSTDPVLQSEIYDGDGEFNKLSRAYNIKVSGKYAVVSSYLEDAVTIIDITDPVNPTKMSEIYDGDGEFDKLDGAYGLFFTGHYLYVTSINDHSLTIYRHF